MKKIITIAMVVCMILTTIVLAIPKGMDIDDPEAYMDYMMRKNSSISDINTKLDDLGSTSVGIIRSPMRSIIAIIRVLLTLLPLVLFLITFIYAIRWLINNKKDKEAEKTKKLSKKAIVFAIATAVSFVLYIGFVVFIVPLSKMAVIF